MDQTGTYGAWLKARRREYGYTQRELAEMVGCSVVTIEKIEEGRNRPSKQMAGLIGQALEVSPGEFDEYLKFARGDQRSDDGAPALASAPWQTPPAAAAAPAQVAYEPELPPTTVNLPAQLTSLIGRDTELRAVKGRLLSPDVRLLTLTGPPGIGKTSLALEAARGLAWDFPGGVYFVPLAPVGEPGLVPAAIANALGLQEEGLQTVIEGLEKYLRGRRALLVLDNFEHLVAAASVPVELMAVCPEVKTLVTSREALHLRGERQFPIGPLDLPGPGKHPTTADIEHSAAVELFVSRAQAVDPSFALTWENAEAVAEICARLDGLPLAIELAAARTKLLPPKEIAARLDKTLPLLRGGPRDLPVRQQTLRGAIEWSYDLLDEGEQRLLARLGIFVGGCSLAAVDAVCNANRDLPFDTLDGLSSLLDKSLLRNDPSQGEEPRFTMLEVIRQYSLERLEAVGEALEAEGLHMAYFLSLGETAAPELRRARQGMWYDLLEREHDNFRAALQRALQSGEVAIVARMVAAIGRFWWVRGHLTEWSRWMAPALEWQESVPVAVRARLVHNAGLLADTLGDYESARGYYEQGWELYREAGDLSGMGIMINNLGHMALQDGDYEVAIPLLEESLALHRAESDTWASMFPLLNLGRVALEMGDYDRAGQLYGESVEVQRRAGDTWSLAIALQALGLVALRQGDYERARELYVESLLMQQTLGARAGIAGCLLGFAELALAVGVPERAAVLVGSVEAAWSELGSQLAPVEKAGYERTVDIARTTLGGDAFAEATRRGRMLSLQEAAQYALA